MDQPTADLDRVRRAAPFFTMSMAVLALVFWGLSAISDAGVVSALGGFFSGATVVGGTAMGLLFLLARARERNASNQQSWTGRAPRRPEIVPELSPSRDPHIGLLVAPDTSCFYV